MAARTPRKRRQSGRSAESRGSCRTPVKKLLVDCSVVLTPLQPRNSNAAKHSAHYTAIQGPGDKENMAGSPQKSNVARKLIVSPQATERCAKDAYVFSPESSPKGAVPARSFYKKDSVYVTPIDRKLINQSKGRGSQDTPPPANTPSARFTRTKTLPAAKKRKTGANTAPLRKTSRNKSTPPPRNKSTPPPRNKSTPPPRNKSTPPPRNKSTPPTKIEGSATPSPGQTVASTMGAGGLGTQKSTILGLKMKPRPKLTVGAAFFSTSKKPHSAPRRPPAHIKFPATIKQSFRPVKENTMPDAVKTDTYIPKTAAGIRLPNNPRPVTSTSEPQRHTETKVEVKKAAEETKTSGTCPQEMFDTDDPIVKSSEKNDSSLYPIFSTPALSKKRPLDLRGDLASPVCSSTPVTAPPALGKVPKLSKRKDANKTGDDQLIIDAGQKHFGPVSCSTCGMIYSAASMEDEAQHVQYHQRLLESIRYVGWKKERVVSEFWDGKILMICPDDPKYALRKAEEVRELVDAELGFQQTSLNTPSRTRTYLYVTNDKRIAGCLIAEPIRQAFRVLAESSSPTSESTLERHRAWRCSSDPQPAICGISRIWVFALMRRKNIASRLVDAVRSSFIYGSHLTTDEIAFSDPTPDGKLFASSYCRVPDFLVYNFLS